MADDIPTDGQILDLLEAALERLDGGYCEQDVELRKALAMNLVRFSRDIQAPRFLGLEAIERHIEEVIADDDGDEY